MKELLNAAARGTVAKAVSIASADNDTTTLVDMLAALKEEKETAAKKYDDEINRIEVELMSRGLRQLEDKSVKFTTFRGYKASVTVGMSRSLKILNADNLKKAVTKKWQGEIRTKEPDYSIAADFNRALISLYLVDYVSEMSLSDLLNKGVSKGGETVVFTNDTKNMLLKKLKGDYEKDKKLFEGIFDFEIGDGLDEELYYIAKIKNWERIRKYFTVDEAMKVQAGLKQSIFVQETARLTMRQ